MINYTSQHQIKLDLFKHPFGVDLDKENRWVKLSTVIPWDKLAEVYSRKLQSGTGRKSVNIRTVIAALIVKHKLRLDDRGTIEMIKENSYLQYFCGLEGFTTEAVFDPSLFVDIRKPLGRPPKAQAQTSSERYRKKKEAAERNHVEGKFGQGKRGYGLNNIKARSA